MIAVAATVAGVIPFAASASPTPSASEEQVLKMYVIGDSYTAGNGTYGGISTAAEEAVIREITGIENAGGYTGAYTNQNGKTVASMRSPYNYGGQAKALLEQDGVRVQYRNFANSGSTIRNSGAGSIINQIADVPSDADVVAFTAGGNDAKFGEIVKSCLVVGMRSPAGCRETIDHARASLPEVRQNTTELFSRLDRKLNAGQDAYAMVMAYPLLSVDSHTVLESKGDSYAVADELRRFGNEAIAMQQEVVDAWNEGGHHLKAVAVNAHVDAFAGHEPDPSFTARNPYRWINEFFETRGFARYGNEKTRSNYSMDIMNFYHPNVSGHHAMAESLVQAIEVAGVVHDADVANVSVRGVGPTLLSAGAVQAWLDGPYGVAPDQMLRISAQGSYNPRGAITDYDWDLDGDGIFECHTTEPHIDHVFKQAGTYAVTVRVHGDSGDVDEATTEVRVSDGVLGEQGGDYYGTLNPDARDLPGVVERQQ